MTRTVTVADTTPPQTTIDSATDGNSESVINGGITTSNSIEFEFSGTDNVSLPINLTFECNLNNLGFQSCTSPHTIPTMIDGNYVIDIRATDEEGNIESTASFSWIVDSVIFCDSMSVSQLIASNNYNLIDNRDGSLGITILGTPEDDLILASDLGNTIRGRAGNDCIIGGSGIDALIGNNGHEQIFGNDGNDKIYGAWGNDIIFGGLGIDDITGGVGWDEIYGNEGNDKLFGNEEKMCWTVVMETIH